ncbi:hypothetical protein FS815_07495 [Agrobacterium vitis]|uniref:hypothetical protein n=1 Tax=Allorhizobium ampelinum TaxID=3025782 RepID=UPI001F22F56F|nr:hypothetical protein [Allorhizobium ampelinum]MCF1446668.1 hypothetical protein [Allorhizobium ampelinum]
MKLWVEQLRSFTGTDLCEPSENPNNQHQEKSGTTIIGAIQEPFKNFIFPVLGVKIPEVRGELQRATFIFPVLGVNVV